VNLVRQIINWSGRFLISPLQLFCGFSSGQNLMLTQRFQTTFQLIFESFERAVQETLLDDETRIKQFIFIRTTRFSFGLLYLQWKIFLGLTQYLRESLNRMELI